MGGKRRVAHIVWERFGADIGNMVEPFFGSGAVLLGRPGGAGDIETANDADGHICNVFRAIAQHPDEIVEHAEWIAHEADLHARHAVLVEQREALTQKLMGDPEYCDVKLAGWWLWGIALWIGTGWCSGEGPWQRVETEDGWKLLHLGDAGRGVNRKLLHLGDAGRGVKRKRPLLDKLGGVHKKSLGSTESLADYMHALSERLRRVRVCCGDWSRVCGPTPTVKQGLTAVFLDPPYSDEAQRTTACYAVDSGSVAHEVREWCLANGRNPLLRIAYCSYGEFPVLPGWDRVHWTAHGGYGAGKGNRGDRNKYRETIDFSPHCIRGLQGHLGLFDSCDDA